MAKVLLTYDGRGKEIADFLRSELGLPEEVISFEVRFAPQDRIVVNCTYYPLELPEDPAPEDDPGFIDVSSLDEPDARIRVVHEGTLDG